MAVWVAAALFLALAPTAAAHVPSRALGRTAALEHARLDAKIWKTQARASQRWRRLTRAERRRALRHGRRARRRAYVRAQAAAEDPSDVGSWAPPFVTATDYEGYAVHAALLHTGKVLMWGSVGAPLGFNTYAWLWDPAAGNGADAFHELTPTDASGKIIPIFCSGMSFMPDGRLLVVGGTLIFGAQDPDDEFVGPAGLNSALVFDPATETWTELSRPPGAPGRWYPSQVLLADGRTLIASGATEEPPGQVFTDVAEIYDPESNSFTVLDGENQRRLVHVYPHLLTMPDGTVLLAGPDPEDSAIFDPGNLADPWTDLPPLSGQRVGGNAVLLPEGASGSSQVAQIGGELYFGSVVASTNEAIDLDDSTPQWSSFPALHTPRWNPNTVLLPDRSMVTIGGDDNIDSSPQPERAVELYDPVTESWRVGPSQVDERGYHSTALLMPDGRVLSTGDNRKSDQPNGQGPDETAEIYSPPYLFKGPRPVITSAPATIGMDAPFTVGATGDIDAAVLIAPTATTHATDMTQRLVPLTTVAESVGTVTLQSPPTAAVAPPGYYMLFLLDDGVPSVAKWVRLEPPPEPPTPPAKQPDTDSEPTPGPADSADVTGPTLRLAFAERRWLRRLRRTGRLRVKVTVDEPAAADLRLLRRKRRVAHAAREMEAGELTVRLRPRRRTLRWLRRAEAPRLRFSVVVTDAGDNETSWTRLLR